MANDLNPYLGTDFLNMGNASANSANFGLPDFGIPNVGNTAPQGGGGIFDGLFNKTGADGSQTIGALSGGLNALQGIGNLALGYKQYGLAEDELKFQQQQAGINNQNQMTTLNNLMRAQADNRRIATGSGPTGDEFVAANGIRV